MVDNTKGLSEYEEYFNVTRLQDFLKSKEQEKLKDEELKKFKCFYKDGFNKSTCESYSFEKDVYGVWDRPCNNNDECPFYLEIKIIKIREEVVLMDTVKCLKM